MRLEELIRPLILHNVTGDLDVKIQGIQMDSRKVQPGDLFIAIRGFTVDGHRFMSQAIDNGAVAVVVEEELVLDIPVVRVPDTRRAMAVIAATFYQHPTQELKLIGITGTNGKTTTSHLIHYIFNQVGRKTGVLGTTGMKIGDHSFQTNNTTPEVIDLQKSFRLMRKEGCEYSVIEASSHALEQGRTRGCQFQFGVFTNLTQDHLDYHLTMERYREAKGMLFSQLGNHYQDDPANVPVAVLNSDDEASTYFAQITSAQVVTYGIEQPADVCAENIKISAQGTSFTLKTFKGTIDLKLHLVGKFNVYNVLAATTVALLNGISLDEIKVSLEGIYGVNGRFESVQAGQPFTVLVDYAHTPDSLENVLTTVQQFVKGKILTVVGCGGDRDRTKRPIMAQIAVKYSDLTLFTSDNPRTEDPKAIISDMINGLGQDNQDKYVTVVDRREAISQAISMAKPEDVVLIAGKGHETYQEIHGVRYDFDDREVARHAIVSQRVNEG